MLKKALPIALALSTALVGTTASAKTISGSVDFRVTLPEVLVLYHWDDAHLILTDNVADGANDSDVDREISDARDKTGTGELNSSDHTISGDVAQPKIANLDKDKVKVTLQNAWAVRALSNHDYVTLKVGIQKNELKSVADASSKIVVSNAQIKSSQAVAGTGGGSAVTEGASLKLPSKWTETMGDINFEMDLSGAKHTGEYNTRNTAGKATTAQEGDDVFLLTLTSEVPQSSSP